MPKVLCSLPNASEDIDGVKFTQHAHGMLSEDVSDEAAARFASIPGYTVVGAPDPAADAEKAAAAQREADEKAAAAEAEKAALMERAAKVELKTKANWSLERLKTEVEAAEKSAADAAAADK